jgi:hypothetical protein
VKEIRWKRNDLGVYSQSANSFVMWNLKNQSKEFELKLSYRLDGGFAVDRDEKFIYVASDDGYIRALHNGQVDVKINLLFDEFRSLTRSSTK